METNRILSSSLLDLVFDNRNKAYGAYYLRTTYPSRIKKALIITGSFALLVFTGTVLGNSFKSSGNRQLVVKDIELTKIDDTKEPEPLPKPLPKPEIPPVERTEHLATAKIVDDKDVQEPPPDQDALTNAKIDVFKQDGEDPSDIMNIKGPDEGKGVVEQSKHDEPMKPFERVEIPAKFDGDWSKFLLRNLRANTPVDNGAPVGKYKVAIRFVVDVNGVVSDIIATSNNGYGMEEEAVRVLKKAEKWKPAIQNGVHVPAYHTQVIVFEVQDAE